MNLFILPAWYPQNEKDVTACFFREQAQALSKRGHLVTVIHIKPLSFTKIFRAKWHSKRIWQDGEIRTVFHQVIVPIPGKFNRLQNWYLLRLYYHIIKKQIKADEKNGMSKPDILHGHVSHSCAYYGLHAARKLDLPYVVTEHYSGLLLGTASKEDYARVRETILLSDAFLFVGSNFQTQICKKFGIQKQTYVVPNMLTVADFSFDKKEKTEAFTFLSACHLTENKSIDKVISAFHEAFPNDSSKKLVIAGDGALRGKLEQFVRQLGETERITFFGRYGREQVNDIFGKADCFVLTSQVETFGIVYLEAMACGLPCIGTKGQGAEDIITEENGIKISYGNQQELVAAMRFMAEHREKYNREKIHQDCDQRFSEESVCRQIEEIYQQVLDCHSHHSNV